MAKETKVKAPAELSPKAVEILDAMKKAGKPLTVAEIKGLGIEGVNASHLTALVNRGLVSTDTTEVEVPTIVKRKVNTYSLVVKE